MSGESGHETYLRRDQDSFTGPLDAALAECTRALADAGKKIRGAQRRADAALDDLESLEQFIDEVNRLLRDRSFHDLPGFRSEDPRLRSLSVGPWRGIFLVSPDGSLVIGLVFSKQPHELEQRLHELVAGYAKQPTP